MPTFVLPTVFFVLTALLALLAIDPNTLAPRLAAYGSMGATALSYLLWPLIVSLAVVVAWLGSRWARAGGRKLREAMDQHVAEIVESRLEQHRRDLAKQDFETLVEKIVRSPDQLEQLANHLGIGPKPTSASGLALRVSKLELAAVGQRNSLSDMTKLDERINLINIDVNSLSEWTRDQLQRRDIVCVLRDGWPSVRDNADILTKIPGQPDGELTWHSWITCWESWKFDYEAWATHFPNIRRFDPVRDVLEVSGEEVSQSHRVNAVAFRFGSSEQEHKYFLFLAQYQRFRKEAGAGLRQMEVMASVDNNRSIT